MFNKAKHLLPDPFPLELLRNMNFGNADGHRDNIAQEAFIITSSVQKFFQNNHSIVVGAIGTGKSTLFRLLKENGNKIEAYKRDLIIPLEEAFSFAELSSFAKEHYKDKEEKTLYQLLWKFNVLSKIAIKISSFENYPNNSYEKHINEFLAHYGSDNAYTSIISKLKEVISRAHIKVEAKIADNPITFEAGAKEKPAKKINLDDLQSAISKAIRERGFHRSTIIIDKIDRFVAGIEYQTQKIFLTALLELDDDLCCDEAIKLKIFLRYDLFERLDFSSLGYDKVSDNVVFLKWSKEEVLRFVATRIVIAIRNAKIVDPEQLIKATNLKEFELTKRERLLLSPIVPRFIKSLITKKKRMERNVSLYEKFDKAIITKIFPRNVIHFSPETQKHEEISIFQFVSDHFLDGNNVCTPRYLLVFLREVVERCASYYDDNPDQTSELVLIDKDYEWDLFKKNCVYEAYVASKDIYVKNIITVEPKWTQNFHLLMNKKGNKIKIDFKWIRANIPDISEEEAVDFLSFMQVIGFVKVIDTHRDIRKRLYELPILYKPSPLPTHRAKLEVTIG